MGDGSWEIGLIEGDGHGDYGQCRQDVCSFGTAVLNQWMGR